MVDREQIRALAAWTPPAPARVVSLDAACLHTGLDGPAAALTDAHEAGCRSTLRLSGFASAEDVTELMAGLAAALGREGRALAPGALAMPGAIPDPPALALAAVGACAGGPHLYLLLPQSALEAIQRRRELGLAGGAEAPARSWWSCLLDLAAAAPMLSLVPEAPGPGVSMLAPAQRWLGPAPGCGELIPAAPRRLRITLDFAQLLDAAGDDPRVLGRIAGRIVTLADATLGRLPDSAWSGLPGPRRLALELAGIARAAQARRRDPRKFATLQWVKSRLGAFRDGACAASIRLARAHGGSQPLPLPGPLEVADGDPLDRALLLHGARHSHLVSLSPWSLAPPELGRDGLGLLPALDCADSICWRRPDAEGPAGWYGEALRFAWAVALRS